jgi:hypothetical protein
MVLTRLGLVGRLVPRPVVLVMVAALLVCGCGSGKQLLPVSGTVTLNGQPLKAGNVQFVPEASGPQAEEIPIGEVRDGKYELATRGKKGAPPGKYKVVVHADQFSGDSAPKAKAGTMEMPKSLINLRYTLPGSTPLAKEVVANPAPDAYDLKLTK